jgi:biopolymer transport protein ExbB
MKSIIITIVLLTGVAAASAQTQWVTAETPLESATAKAQKRLDESLAELNRLQERIAADIAPLNARLSELEQELQDVRAEYQKTSATLDNRTLALSNLTSEIKTRRDEAAYVSSLLSEYIRNFESLLHIVELERYKQPLEAATLAAENTRLSEKKVFEAQTALLSESLERLHRALGGDRFEGQAEVTGGEIKDGTFVLLGPAALFKSADGLQVGTAEQRLGSVAPVTMEFATPDHTAATTTLIEQGAGRFPLDPTLGNAHKIEATKESLWEHIQNGGPVMVPIIGLAGAALLVALYKWVGLLFVKKPSQRRIGALLNAVARRDQSAAMVQAKAIGGPVGQMLAVGVEHLREPRELIEEIMYETVLTTRLRLQRLLPFIAISAASAPLLGLLGTVTGIISTFKMIKVFGAGDVKTLSGGISEALITTEFGLIVAIPSLLLHAFLSRKARGIVDQMEKSAVSFVNQVSKTPYDQTDAGAPAVPPPPPSQSPPRDESESDSEADSEADGPVVTTQREQQPEVRPA